MTNQYITLFKEVSNMASILAEQVMDYDKEHNDDAGYKTAQTMRNDYNVLYDKMRADDFNIESLTKNDYIKLLAGAMIVVNNLEERLEIQKRAINGYRTLLIPKLDHIVQENVDGENLTALVKECFRDGEEV